ncbi:zinc finger MYM-type protein 5-like [Belonocnema kinseyi]|uniref:zinc finger MYM-type protein 5-like n=1 Tax=Belonocnema kinseyi TaxID=2817044 RepID=UPI00143D3AA8|nr:zinc finger MYM-type protein 5-like [Belonocnema kinseyi]
MSDKNSNVKRKPSGYEYRKRKTEKEQKFEQSKKFMNIEKYVVQKTEDEGTKDLTELSSTSSLDTNVTMEVEPTEQMGVVLLGDNAPVQIQEQEIVESDAAGVHVEEINDEKFKDKTRETLNLYDCGTWPVLRNSSTVDHLIKIGPIQIKNENYPEVEKRRHFSNSYYNRKLSNSAIFCRRWLVYSVSKDSIF